ncbi:MAG TPA: response regulator transcription factor [Bdellovibrionales bacterium]|nr:response regulator transcription factor [Bdellovibrionales bacterium]
MRQALLIEDSPEYQLLVRVALADRFNVVCVGSAAEALRAVSTQTFDLLLLDVGLPGRDGLSLCQELRRDPRLRTTPILFVTGRAETQDLVQGFEMGADDYITKPFHPEELKARIEARFKRVEVAPVNHDQYWKADLRFAIGRQRVTHTCEGRDRELDLTPNEFKILFFLARNEGRVVSRADVLREVWGENLHVIERTVDKHICSLRRKMGVAARYVASVPGTGYQFQMDVRESRRPETLRL